MSTPISSISPVPQQEEKRQEEQKLIQPQKERAVNPLSIRPENLVVSYGKENIKITQLRRLFGF